MWFSSSLLVVIFLLLNAIGGNGLSQPEAGIIMNPGTIQNAGGFTSDKICVLFTD